MLTTLKWTLTGSGPSHVFHMLCSSAAAQPIVSVSASDSSSTPSSTNRKCTDMVLSIPGRRTFNVDASTAMVR
jgi:hypothetical protein